MQKTASQIADAVLLKCAEKDEPSYGLSTLGGTGIGAGLGALPGLIMLAGSKGRDKRMLARGRPGAKQMAGWDAALAKALALTGGAAGGTAGMGLGAGSALARRAAGDTKLDESDVGAAGGGVLGGLGGALGMRALSKPRTLGRKAVPTIAAGLIGASLGAPTGAGIGSLVKSLRNKEVE